MRKFVAKIFTAIMLLTPVSAIAQDVCFTPSKFEEAVASVAEQSSIQTTLLRYEGSDVVVIRDHIEKQTGSEAIEFDTMMIGIKEGHPVALVVLFKDGCAVLYANLSLDEVEKIKEVVKGV